MNWTQVFNPNTECRWGCFRSDVGSMMNMGWEFESSEEQDYTGNVRIFGRLKDHRISCVAIISRYDLRNSHDMMHSHRPLVLNMDITGEIRVQINNLNLVEMYAGYPTSPTMDEWHIIGGERENNIYVEEESVSDLLLKIKELQTPTAKDILKRQGDKLIIPDAKMTAKILSF